MTEGDKVTVSGVISYDHLGNDWVEIRFSERFGGTAIVPRSLPSPPPTAGPPSAPRSSPTGTLTVPVPETSPMRERTRLWRSPPSRPPSR